MINAAFYALITSAIGIIFDEMYYWLSLVFWTVVAYSSIWKASKRFEQIAGIWFWGVVVWQAHEYILEFLVEHPWIQAVSPWAWGGIAFVILAVIGRAISTESTDALIQTGPNEYRLRIRYYFRVPYDEKEFVKAYGARWDNQKRLWYVQSEEDFDALCRLGYQPTLTD